VNLDEVEVIGIDMFAIPEGASSCPRHRRAVTKAVLWVARGVIAKYGREVIDRVRVALRPGRPTLFDGVRLFSAEQDDSLIGRPPPVG
jgi:hypothetical protein